MVLKMPVKIGLDVRMVNQSGIGTTVSELLKYSLKEKEKLILFGGPDFKNGDFDTRQVPYPVYGLSQHILYGRYLKKQNLSLFHMPHFDVPFFYPGPFVATVHDLIHYLFPQYSSKPFTRLYSRILFRHISRKAKRIIVVSENTKKDLVKLFPESEPRIRVVYPGVGAEYSAPSFQQVQSTLLKYQISKSYLLYVGNLRPSKNTLGLVNAYIDLAKALSSKVPQLILVGKNFYRKPLPHHPSVKVLGKLSQEDIVSLYSGALAFVFPSFYEGFGLPPLEAMACGTPVVSSNRASLPEVCGEAAVFFDPNQPDELVRALKEIIQNETLRKMMILKGIENVRRFSWNQFGSQTWDVYREALAEIGPTS